MSLEELRDRDEEFFDRGEFGKALESEREKRETEGLRLVGSVEDHAVRPLDESSEDVTTLLL